MPVIEREPGVELHWEERGDGPTVLVALGYIQHPEVMASLVADLADGHRVVRYDPRGCGLSTRMGPFDMETDVEDLIAVLDAVGPVVAVLANGDATNRASHAAVRRPDLVPVLISMETVPLLPGSAEGTDALVSSGGVLEALVSMMRTDYRSALTATIQRGNPDLSPQDARDRVDATAAYVTHEAALARLEEWIRDQPDDDARALGDRLVVAYQGDGSWFPKELLERGRELLPEARFVKLDGGAITRPDLTAAVVRQVTGVPAAGSR